jgi:hypothetical protein
MDRPREWRMVRLEEWMRIHELHQLGMSQSRERNTCGPCCARASNSYCTVLICFFERLTRLSARSRWRA